MSLEKSQSYRLGSLYAVATAFLLAVQEPFSFLAARTLNWEQFVLVTQLSLLVSVPLLLVNRSSRSDFAAIFATPAMYGKLAVIFALGITGLVLYKLGLTGSHPIIIAAIFNLSPFWAAAVARVISRVPIPVAPLTFFACLATAFSGAMAVAWSQLNAGPAGDDLLADFLRGSWIYALPIPILSALNGTLIGKWFSNYREQAAIAANFLVPAAVLIPAMTIALFWRGEIGMMQSSTLAAVLLMMLGTIVAAAVGRVFYQVALTVTGGDNGFVTMFFLLVPALTGLISWPLSLLIPPLHVRVGALFFGGLGLIAVALLAFSYQTWRREREPRAAGVVA